MPGWCAFGRVLTPIRYLVVLVGVPVDEPLVVIGDEHLPFALRALVAAHPHRPVRVDAPSLTGPAEDIGARVGGVGEHVVHRMIGRLDPGDVAAAQIGGRLQRELQPVVTQPQPHRAHRAAHREPLEDRGDDAGNRLVGMAADLTVGFAPDQSDRQATAQLAAGGLVTDPAVEAGAQNMQFSFGHGAFHAQQHPVVEQPRVVDAVGVGDQRVAHAGQIQQPIPVGVIAGQTRNLQRQNDSHLPEPDLRGQFGEPGPAGGAGPAAAEVLVDHPDRGGWPTQLHRPRDQIVLAGGGLPVAGDLSQGGLADIHHRGPTQMRGGELGLTHLWPPRFRSSLRRIWRSRWPAT